MATQKAESIHDRLAEIPALQREGVVVAIVPDPYAQGANIRVLRATRDDPLAGMLARGQIDQAQYEAGRIWQLNWETAVVGAIRAIDTTREPVDGHGPTPQPFTERRTRAFTALREAAARLGFEGDRIVHAVLAERMQIVDLAARHGRPRKYMGQRFRECLETLARLWGLAPQGKP